MTDADGFVRTATTNALGYYRFADVSVGETYVFQVRSKQYSFAPQAMFISEEPGEINFTQEGLREYSSKETPQIGSEKADEIR